MGEVVDRNTFAQRPGTEPHHDLADRTLRQTPWLHRRVDVDYNAWWMCLIPRSIAEELGLPLPLFIKWDDAEYGLRARAAGYRTATVPGIAIWHMSFLEKDDTSDWQAYFHYRNRYVAAALHGPDNPRALLVDTLKRTVRHLMLMEYSAVALQEMALRDFLAGPTESRTAGDGLIRPSAPSTTTAAVDSATEGAARPGSARPRKSSAAAHPRSPSPSSWPARAAQPRRAEPGAPGVSANVRTGSALVRVSRWTRTPCPPGRSWRHIPARTRSVRQLLRRLDRTAGRVARDARLRGLRRRCGADRHEAWSAHVFRPDSKRELRTDQRACLGGRGPG